MGTHRTDLIYLVGFILLWGTAVCAFAIAWTLRSTRDGIRAHIATLPTEPPGYPGRPDPVPDGDTVPLPVGVARTKSVSVDRQPTKEIRPPHTARHLRR